MKIYHTKDFKKWHGIKDSIHEEKERLFYHEREVWWCHLGVNIGFEQDGKGLNFERPVLIIKGFSKEVFLCIPLTTKLKSGRYYHPIVLGDHMERRVILSQIRLVDSKRLVEKIGTIDEIQFTAIKKAITRLLE